MSTQGVSQVGSLENVTNKYCLCSSTYVSAFGFLGFILFPQESVAAAQAILGAGKTWWYQGGSLLPFRRNDGQVHLPPRNNTAKSVKSNTLTLRLLAYNCRTFGFTQAKLVEIAEDLHMRGVHVAALQGTCWKHGTVRWEWQVKNRNGQPIFSLFFLEANVQSGIVLLLSCDFLTKAYPLAF